MNVKILEGPFTTAKLASLRCGQVVRLSGRVIALRDLACRCMVARADAVDLTAAAVFHCGPLMVEGPDGWRPTAAGPTLSARLDGYAGMLLQRGVRVIIGGGTVGEEVRLACARHGAVYLQAVAGAAARLAHCLGPAIESQFMETCGASGALWAFDAKGFEATVVVDVRGHSLQRKVRTASRRHLDRLLKGSARSETV